MGIGGGMVGVWGLRPGWAVGFGFGVRAEWGPGLVNADWGPVNADLEPRPGLLLRLKLFRSVTRETTRKYNVYK